VLEMILGECNLCWEMILGECNLCWAMILGDVCDNMY